jgi:hypothetical protein
MTDTFCVPIKPYLLHLVSQETKHMKSGLSKSQYQAVPELGKTLLDWDPGHSLWVKKTTPFIPAAHLITPPYVL